MRIPFFSGRRLRHALSGLVLCVLPGFGGEGLITAGVRTMGFVDFEPGQDFLHGIEIGYSDYRLAGHSLEIQLAYLTTRPEAAFRQGVLRQDWYQLSPLFHFRRRNLFDPTLQLDFGYHRYDVENEEIFGKLDNSTWTYGAKAGLALNFAGGRYSLRYALGYESASAESSLIFPLPFSLGFHILFL